MSLPQQALAASLLNWFQDEFPLDVALAFPGVRLDTSDLPEWLELSLSTWTRPPQRNSARRQLSLSLTIHAFVKPQLDKSRIHQLSDAVSQTIARQTVALRDYDSSGSPIIGYARFLECETQHLTRSEAGSHALQHLAVHCPLLVHEI